MRNTMKCVIIMLTFSLASCVFFMEGLVIDHEEVKEIEILNRKDNRLTIILTDPIAIERFLKSSLNGARRDPAKFQPNYQLNIKEIDTTYLVYINGRRIRRGGLTYISSNNVENAIEALSK